MLKPRVTCVAKHFVASVLTALDEGGSLRPYADSIRVGPAMQWVPDLKKLCPPLSHLTGADVRAMFGVSIFSLGARLCDSHRATKRDVEDSTCASITDLHETVTAREDVADSAMECDQIDDPFERPNVIALAKIDRHSLLSSGSL